MHTRALEHGEGAWGAKYLPAGFARTVEEGLAIALAAPHYARLVDDHADNALSGEPLREKITKPYGMDVPSAFTARRIRVFAAWSCDPSGNWRERVYPAFEDNSPFTPESATAFIRAHLAKDKDLGTNQHDIVYLLESLVGPDVVASAICDAFEALSDDELAADRHQHAGWARAAGIVLLRTSKAVGDKLAARLDAMIDRGLAVAAEKLSFRSIAVSLHRVRRGHVRAATPAWPEIYFPELPFWSDAPVEALRTALKKVEIDKWSFSVEPRLVMLAGDSAIELYRTKYKILDGDNQRLLVELFGGIDRPLIRALMTDMAASSRAKAAAKAWLDGGALAKKAPAKKAPAKKAPAKKAPAKKAPAKKKRG